MKNLLQKFVVYFLYFISSQSYASELLMKQGTGEFVVDGGVGRSDLPVTIHYNYPKKFTVNSPILIVLPGNARNANKYRDRWIQASEKHGVLILSPSYSKVHYPKSANYNLGRMVKKLNGQFTIRENQNDWIFSDLDRIFDLVVQSTGSLQTQYDLFGHSAGGQLSHRLAMFSPQNKTNRILAANSGWYTLIDHKVPFPFGLSNSPFNTEKMNATLQKAFTNKLVIFLGEKDDENETRGGLRRGVEVDKQGLSRIDRGRLFYKTAQEFALSHQYTFNWSIVVISGVGHSSTKMSIAAAKFLYSNN